MNIQAEKLHLMKLLLETENKSILAQIKSIFDASAGKDVSEGWDDEVTTDVEEAIAELERGEGIPHEVVMKEFAKWRRK